MGIAIISGAKASTVEVAGKIYCLLFTGDAMFSLQEAFGPEFYNKLTDRKILYRVTAVLSEEGEKTKRFAGLTGQEPLTEEAIHRLASPMDVLNITKACTDAITLGFGREIENNDSEEKIDLVLLEAQKKRD